ncbi:MAG: hypothetical protein AB1656_20400 [Candidatus Omnitrophota bacterium]
MKKALFVMMVLSLAPLSGWTQFFTPGNVIFADPVDDRVVELKLSGGFAEIVQIVTWPLGDMSRRRPLGLDISPDGTVWVAVTGVPKSATEAVEFPTGRAEVLRITGDGKQTFFGTPANKGTFLSTSNSGEVFIMSNAIETTPSIQYRIQVQGDEISEITEFILSQSLNFYGEALELPDGRILMGSNGEDGILVFSQDGGAPTGKFVQTNRYRSLTYIPENQKIIALRTDQSTIDRFDLNGTLEDTINAADYLYPSLWGTARIPGTTKFLVGSHNGPAATKNYIGVFDAANFDNPPEEYVITGFEKVGLAADHQFGSLFNMASVVQFTPVASWELY